jgi:hypothetical protein
MLVRKEQKFKKGKHDTCVVGHNSKPQHKALLEALANF